MLQQEREKMIMRKNNESQEKLMKLAEEIDSMLTNFELELEEDGKAEHAAAINALHAKIETAIMRTRATALRIEK
jgi:hypothetical protein